MLTPFIEGVRSRRTSFPNDWRWEREWRVPVHLEFDLTDIAMIVADDKGALAFFDEVSAGVPWMSSDDYSIRWSGGFTEGWDAEIDSMLERFHEQFVTVDEAGLPWDGEEKAYFQIVEILDTGDAMEEAFGHLAPGLHEAIEQGLDSTSMSWCRIYDLESAYD